MTEYSGFRWSLFFLAEYTSMIAVSSIATTLWLGGWLRPFPNLLGGKNWDLAFSLVPGLSFWRWRRLCFFCYTRMPRIRAMRCERYRTRLALAAFLVCTRCRHVVAGRTRADTGHLSGSLSRVGFFMYLYIWYRATFPRYRFDQLMKIGWKVLLPISIGVVILTALIGVRQELFALMWR